jgi:hypothetical protein
MVQMSVNKVDIKVFFCMRRHSPDNPIWQKDGMWIEKCRQARSRLA